MSAAVLFPRVYLSTGGYNYSLTSVTDANGCMAESLGSNITVTVAGDYLYVAVDSLFRTEIPTFFGNDRRSYEQVQYFRQYQMGLLQKHAYIVI